MPFFSLFSNVYNIIIISTTTHNYGTPLLEILYHTALCKQYVRRHIQGGKKIYYYIVLIIIFIIPLHSRMESSHYTTRYVKIFLDDVRGANLRAVTMTLAAHRRRLESQKYFITSSAALQGTLHDFLTILHHQKQRYDVNVHEWKKEQTTTHI